MNETAHQPVDAVFRSMSRQEAEAYFRDWVGGMDARIERFKRAVAERGGPPLGLDRAGVAAAGAWILDALQEGPRDGPLPRWAQRPMGSGAPGRVSVADLWLLDGLAAFFCEALRRARPGVIRWELNTDKRDMNYQQPQLTGLGAAPFAHVSIVAGTFGARAKSPTDPGWLAGLYDRWLARAEADQPGPAGDVIDDVDVLRIEGDPDWDAEIWISDAAESMLGREGFEQLEAQIRAIQGIDRLAWEDRERFLARVKPGTDLEALRIAVAAVLRRAGEGSS